MTRATLTVRPFTEQDRPIVVALWERCDLTRPWNDPGLDIDRKLAAGPAGFLIGTVTSAVGSPEIVASVMVGYDGHRGWINYLAVDPGRRRRGIGERLMAVAEQRLLAVGCPKINLQIRRTNLGAVEFYRSLGFVEDEVTSMGKRLIDDAPPSVG